MDYEAKARELLSQIQGTCQDIASASINVADDIYNDKDVLFDVIGDRVYDMTNGNNEDIIRILTELEKGSHSAMAKACHELIRFAQKP